MNLEPIFVKKVKEVNTVVASNYQYEKDIGILNGLAGIALFQFYYSKYFGTKSNADLGVGIISNIIDKIDNGYSIPTHCRGLAGFAWVIQHLKNTNFVYIDCDDLFSYFEDYLYEQMKYDMGRGNYDFLHGALGYAFHFYTRFINTKNKLLKKKYTSYLNNFLELLEESSIRDENYFKWTSPETSDTFNFGLSHGISSIINFLSRINKFEEFNKVSTRLLKGSVEYVLSYESSDEYLSAFPNLIEENNPIKYNSRLAWCYGDLGIALSLFKAGSSINNSDVKNKSIEIIIRTASRKLPKDTFVKDAGICHGSFGNAMLYHKCFEETKIDLFKQMFHFWLEDGLGQATHYDGYAGFKQWSSRHRDWIPKLSLLEGVSGIGLTMLGYLSNDTFLWNECLMIN